MSRLDLMGKPDSPIFTNGSAGMAASNGWMLSALICKIPAGLSVSTASRYGSFGNDLLDKFMNEKRGAPRRRVLKAGTIEFGGGAIDCTVRNVSETGASLEVTSPLGIPENFTLVIPSDGQHFSCRVVYRKERRIGVTFAG